MVGNFPYLGTPGGLVTHFYLLGQSPEPWWLGWHIMYLPLGQQVPSATHTGFSENLC
jgi:hypothetical protein